MHLKLIEYNRLGGDSSSAPRPEARLLADINDDSFRGRWKPTPGCALISFVADLHFTWGGQGGKQRRRLMEEAVEVNAQG